MGDIWARREREVPAARRSAQPEEKGMICGRAGRARPESSLGVSVAHLEDKVYVPSSPFSARLAVRRKEEWVDAVLRVAVANAPLTAQLLSVCALRRTVHVDSMS